MPIYEYVCEKCSHEFEELARTMNGGTRPDCPECGAKGTKRKVSVFSAREGLRASAAPSANCGRPECAGGRCQSLS